MSRSHEDIVYDVLMSLLGLSIIILGILLFICFRKKKKKKPLQTQEVTVHNKVCACRYSLTDVDAATDGFNDRRIIGKGRLGTVYAAVMHGGGLVAVKRIHPGRVLSNAGFGFSAILKSLSLAHHPHVVSILGFAEAPGERVIVMEFVGMMSLDFYLHQNPDSATLLDWAPRIRIAAGAGRGLEYLHEVMSPNVVHGCVKPSNILIDDKFCARVCDYGLGFLAPYERDGLAGYVDDEYWINRRGGSKESDVFGFGVVLLELLSGRRSEEGLIVEWALPLIKENRLGEVLDPRLVVPSDLKPLVRLAKVASACVSNSRKNRPSIAQLVPILNNLEDGAMSSGNRSLRI